MRCLRIVNNLNLMTHPFIKGVNRSISKYEFLSFQGAQWLKVFYHRPGENGVYFKTEEEFMNINEKQRYSIYGELNENFKINGKYEFLIYYPELSKYNWWRQSKLPYDDIEKSDSKTAEGYEDVSISMPGSDWGGLVRQTISHPDCSNQCSFIEGSVGVSQYYFAIGIKYSRKNVPADDDWVEDVYLFIRIIGVDLLLFLSKKNSKQLNNLPLFSIFIIHGFNK